MLISESMQKIIRVLLNTKKLTLRKLSSECGVSLGISSKIINQLEKTEYLVRKRGFLEVRNYRKLLNAWAYSSSITDLKKLEFIGAESPSYLIKKISLIANKNKLEHAFTLFAGTEIVCPYVTPSEVHFYILESEKKEWENDLRKERIFPAEKGNIICFLADKSYVDLFSFGGRGEEAAAELSKVIKNV